MRSDENLLETSLNIIIIAFITMCVNTMASNGGLYYIITIHNSHKILSSGHIHNPH